MSGIEPVNFYQAILLTEFWFGRIMYQLSYQLSYHKEVIIRCAIKNIW